VRVVAQGLAGSPWYQADWRRRDPGLRLLALTDADAWRRLAALNGGAAYLTADAEPPPELAPQLRPRGLLYGLGDAAAADSSLWALDARRGDYRYESQPDFFTSDLIDGRAQALLRAGAAAASAGRAAEARPLLESSWAMHWALPEAPLYLGFLEYAAGHYEPSRRVYTLATGVLDGLTTLAERYRALPQVSANIRRSAADALAQLGVVNEKLGQRDEALRCYEASLARVPTAQAHYDLAVLFWGRDWPRAERELEETLRLEPGREDAARFLQTLRARKR
jgi:tetratricopeptide (TPR) repeat protein